ncbi:universal stress protein [Thalassiella azotivora]
MDAQREHRFEVAPTGVVVGYDGSRTAGGAVAWGVAEARLRGLPLHVVRAWRVGAAVAATDAPFGTVPSWRECEEAMTRSMDEALAAVDLDGVEVHRHVVHGPGAKVLVSASQDADLLVVAHRGAGGFAGLVVGSTAEQVVRHAACTVVVVRPGRDER